jgi:molecular chaperone DnaK (HSP70)
VTDARHRAEIDESWPSAARPAMPKVQELVKQLLVEDGHTRVNPDEVVAVGAGLVLAGEVKDVVSPT